MFDELAQIESAFAYFARPLIYRRGTVTHTLRAFGRGLRADELAGAADQFDRYIVILAKDFDATSLGIPMRFDRVEEPPFVYGVFDWRPSPAIGAPSFYKLMVKGGAP